MDGKSRDESIKSNESIIRDVYLARHYLITVQLGLKIRLTITPEDYGMSFVRYSYLISLISGRTFKDTVAQKKNWGLKDKTWSEKEQL